MTKITIIGAGSHVFSRRLISDILTWPSLREATLSLMDLNPDSLGLMTTLAGRMIKQMGLDTPLEATTDLRTALTGADYVIVAIRVDPGYNHVSVPAKYGVMHSIGDTSGPGGVFYFLKNAPALIEMAQTMQEVCPDALMLNYSNPMVMLSWAVTQATGIRYVGLCHSVQGTARNLADYIGVPFEEVSYLAAGINHMAWFLRYEHNKVDAYPQIFEAMEDPEIYARDRVKFEVMKHFGAFVSESSLHLSEYLPYFRRTPEMRERYIGPGMWGVEEAGEVFIDRWNRVLAQRKVADEEVQRLAYGDEPLEIDRSHEFCTHILNSCETNEPYQFNGNVPNTDLICNLPGNAVVEVPILVDAIGLHPCHVGDLPPALAALNRTNLNVQELAVEGLLQSDRDLIHQAVKLDPLTSSLLTLDEIDRMVDEMFEADARFISI